MSKPALGLALGGILGLLDGLSAYFSPAAAPMMLQIVVGSTLIATQRYGRDLAKPATASRVRRVSSALERRRRNAERRATQRARPVSLDPCLSRRAHSSW